MNPRRLTVFCGSATGTDPRHAAAVDAVAAGIVRRGLGLVYGGASIGLMGRLADAVLAGGGEVLGVLPRALADREIAHRGLSTLEIVSSMHERKARMASLCGGFLTLPGGFGTFDELCEILTWRQLRIHTKPCGILDAGGYFAGLIQQFETGIASGFIRPENWGTIFIDDDPERLLDRMMGESQTGDIDRGAPSP
jgi:uncharacterized protein (TIGR00730 family)